MLRQEMYENIQPKVLYAAALLYSAPGKALQVSIL